MSVHTVSLSPTHSFSKTPSEYIYLVPSYGVSGDAHSDSPSEEQQTNAREVHLIPYELLTSLSSLGITPGTLGENITTQGVDLLSLSEGSKLHFQDADGAGAVVRITGYREPWRRLDCWPEGVIDLIKAKSKSKSSSKRAKVGVYGIVEQEGYVQAGYGIYVEKNKGGRALGAV